MVNDRVDQKLGRYMLLFIIISLLGVAAYTMLGATNPKEAAEGTIRADFASSIDANAVHGSDSPESAAREIAYFFAASEICER